MPSVARLIRGQLVEINGLQAPKATSERWRQDGDKGARDFNGQQGQLIEFSDETGEWTVATFSADMVSVPESNIRPLTTDDLADCDIALGPASDTGVMGAELTDSLSQKGYALCKLFVAPEDLTEMANTADRCVEGGAFSRLPPELETGYLGKEGKGKTLSVDLESTDTADFLRESPLKIFEDAIETVGTLLRPFVETELGFDIYSRSSTMMSLPFSEDEDLYSAPELENEEAASFLSMMWRAKVMILINSGPGASVLTLTPKAITDQDPVEPQLTIQPGMLCIFSMDRYKFACSSEGKALSLSAFFLDAPREYVIDNITGDLTFLTGSISGPSQPKVESVPVVSMGMRYAFGVDEPWKTWVAYAKAGWDTIVRHPTSRWDCDMYYDPDADQTSGKSYTCHGGFSDGIELFDCRFFDISPAEARGMDPTQRQVLEVSYISLQGAGWTKKSLQAKPANIGVFVGLDKNEWNSIPKDISGGFAASSGANAITANRFNYCMNLKGASMTIDTACSASLVCTHTAKLYLLHKHYDPCEAVVICGVNLSLSPLTYVSGCGAGMHSHLGRCFTYNFSADGYTRGEATASTALKLKPFEREQGDFCLLAGSQVNQDGRSASLTAPNGPAQERCAQAVMKEIGVKPPEIDTTECHGTGTSLGDPIEIGAYRKVMASVPRHEPVVITSSKSNIGHCEGSAGISGFLKCVLLSLYGEATPNCHLNCLNPHLDMTGFPGIITTENVTFRAEASYNGVLSFGFGGTNACATVWGVNQMTSRGVGTNKDLYSLFIRKMQDAPPQEVTIVGDDWEDWEMGGPDKDARFNDIFEVELDPDGVVSYWKKDKEVPDMGCPYYITGTFNDWKYEEMEADASVPGLFYASIRITANVEEEFQILADKEPKMTFHPSTRTSMKSSTVRGPEETKRENCWCVRGSKGERYRVEFYRSDTGAATVSWLREQ